MNSKTSPEIPEFESPSESLADSLIAVHARLGTGNDDELISKILDQTVSRSAVAQARPSFGIHNWAILGTSVAAVVAILLLVLSNTRLRDHSRSSDTFQFVVKMAAPVSLPDHESDRGTGVKNSPSHFSGETRRFEGRLDPVARAGSEVSTIKLNRRNYDLVTGFNPSLDGTPTRETRIQSITISADESVHKGTEVIYSGKVVVTHKDFILTADFLDVLLDTESGVLIARGPAELKLGNGEIKTLDPDVEELVLNGEAYSIRSLRFENNAGTAPGIR